MRCVPSPSRALVIVAVALSLSACNGNSGLSPTPNLSATNQASSWHNPNQQLHRRTSSSKIQHVVIIVQENRSFNNLFMGYPGAKTSTYGYTSDNQKITLQPVGLETTWDIDHSSNSFFEACNGTGSYPGTDCQMNGFNKEWVGCGGRGEPGCPNSHPQYSYVPRSETKPYFQMAKQFVLADERCTSRTLTQAALSRINTSSPARPKGQSTIRGAGGAVRAEAAMRLAR